MIALVHLLTIGWISGSILGTFYVVAPLALVVPMTVSWRDWAAWVAFAGGASGVAAHFWIGTYDGMAWSAALVLAAVAWVGGRGSRGLSTSPAPAAVRAHVRLAFANMLAAGALGILIGIDRSRGLLALSPIDLTYAHAHIAALGWAVMMIVGLGYRLFPMVLPSAMPAGSALWLSAALIEGGLMLLTITALTEHALMPAGAILILAGVAAFVWQIARSALRRKPKPPSLPGRDWSVIQIRICFAWLLVACGLGYWLSRADAGSAPRVAWIYGTAGLLGFIGQMIAAMHGRLIPYYAWYQAMALRDGAPPQMSVHALISGPLAFAVCATWAAGVPCMAFGLASQNLLLFRAGAILLLAGVVAGACQISTMVLRAGRDGASSGGPHM
jgi:hypothetical protein